MNLDLVSSSDHLRAWVHHARRSVTRCLATPDVFTDLECWRPRDLGRLLRSLLQRNSSDRADGLLPRGTRACSRTATQMQQIGWTFCLRRRISRSAGIVLETSSPGWISPSRFLPPVVVLVRMADERVHRPLSSRFTQSGYRARQHLSRTGQLGLLRAARVPRASAQRSFSPVRNQAARLPTNCLMLAKTGC